MKKQLFFMVLLAVSQALSVTAQEQTELTTSEAKSLYKNTSKRYVSVHDPSVVWEPSSKRYYIFGSHKAGAYTTDMQNWTTANPTWRTASVATNAANNVAFTTPQTKKVKIGGEEVDFVNFNAMEWSARTDANYNVNGNMWAPDVIWNKQMQKWCMYLSINGDAWHSSIILLTSDKIAGPYLYQGPVVICGFQDSGHSYKDTDLELAIGTQNSLPSRYNVGGGWGRRWPHTIDPCVFYDEEGQLWMVYGSWSGGIWMLELDEETGLRDYDVKYPSTNGNSDGVLSDPYYGKKVGGGYYVSGEAPYIEYIGGYYYLFITYGYLDSVGGYVMRVFRSTNPDGPYRDASNRSAIFSNYVMNYGTNGDKRGVKIIGPYDDWGFMTTGELAQGHNSIIAAEDGRTYLVYHTRFNNGGEGHQVRVHQMFQTKNGWLVASPFEYNGEQLTDTCMTKPTTFDNSDILGTYQILVHKYEIDHANREVVYPVKITLHDTGVVTGAYSGLWSVDEGTSYLTLKLGGSTYNCVIFEQQMDKQSIKTIAFTGLCNNGVNVWGYKMQPQYELAWHVNRMTRPVTNNSTISKDIDLYSMDLGLDNTTLEWKSSNADLISDYGKYNPTGLTEDTPLTLTARLTTGNYFWTQEFNVKAASESLPVDGWAEGMVAHYGFDGGELTNTFNPQEEAKLFHYSTTKSPTLADDQPLRTGSYAHLYAGANGKESFVRVPNPFYGRELTDGATISFWVKRADANLYDALFGVENEGQRFFVTGNLYAGFNDGAGKWLDINHPDRVRPTQLSAGEWHLLTVTISRTATSATGGLMFYIDGSRKSGDNFNGEIDGTAITAKGKFDYNLMVDLLASSPYLYMGYGSFWGSPEADVDDLILYDRAISYSEVMALNKMENRVFDFHSLTSGIAEVQRDSQRGDSNVYTLMGTRLTTPVSALKQGLYIIGGRKVMVR